MWHAPQASRLAVADNVSCHGHGQRRRIQSHVACASSAAGVGAGVAAAEQASSPMSVRAERC
jgi:hypothetical protein